MAKKTRPTFTAPLDKAAPRPAGSQWVYRSDAAPATGRGASPAELPRAPVARRPVAVASPAAAPPSGVIVNCAALLLFPIAAIVGLVVEPLTACCRRTR